MAAGQSIGVLLDLINTLKILFYPFIPFSSRRAHGLLGFSTPIADCGWAIEQLPSGQKLGRPELLFTRLEDR